MCKKTLKAIFLQKTAEITAESLKLEMAEIVKKDPAKPMSAAIKTVRERAEERYGDGEGFYEEVLDALGGDDAIARRLIDVRAKIIGPTPKNRNQFHPHIFLSRIYGENKVIVMDSNELDEDKWEEAINGENPFSDRVWKSDNMRRFRNG